MDGDGKLDVVDTQLAEIKKDVPPPVVPPPPPPKPSRKSKTRVAVVAAIVAKPDHSDLLRKSSCTGGVGALSNVR